jgi:hypothetical protein
MKKILRGDSAKGDTAITPGMRRCGLVNHTRVGEDEWEARNRGCKTSFTAIISTAALEEVLYPLDKALTAVVLGMDINIVFGGAGVRLMKQGYRPRLSGWIG